MHTRRFNITHLLENGVRLIGRRLIIDYRYIRDDLENDNRSAISIYATVVDGNPIILCNSDIMYFPNELTGNSGVFTTTILELPDKTITGLYVEVLNSDIVEIKRIALIVAQASSLIGHNVSTTGSLKILSCLINNGDIFSEGSTVVVKSICLGDPTHYRISKFNDFRDFGWSDYREEVFFELYEAGLNTIYYQVKNAEEESVILERSIGWHGFEKVIAQEQCALSDVITLEGIVISKPVIVPSLTLDDVEIEEIDMSDSIVRDGGEWYVWTPVIRRILPYTLTGRNKNDDEIRYEYNLTSAPATANINSDVFSIPYAFKYGYYSFICRWDFGGGTYESLPISYQYIIEPPTVSIDGIEGDVNRHILASNALEEDVYYTTSETQAFDGPTVLSTKYDNYIQFDYRHRKFITNYLEAESVDVYFAAPLPTVKYTRVGDTFDLTADGCETWHASDLEWFPKKSDLVLTTAPIAYDVDVYHSSESKIYDREYMFERQDVEVSGLLPRFRFLLRGNLLDVRNIFGDGWYLTKSMTTDSDANQYGRANAAIVSVPGLVIEAHGQNVVTQENPYINNLTNFTMTIWIKIPSSSTSGMIASFPGGSYLGFAGGKYVSVVNGNTVVGSNVVYDTWKLVTLYATTIRIGIEGSANYGLPVATQAGMGIGGFNGLIGTITVL
jgi:hypothetical protein